MSQPIDPVAEALARLYDVDLLEDPGDVDLYVALAARAGGPILELGVGSGRIAVPLAQAGYDVTGIDRDPAMLARAAERAAKAGPAVARRLDLIEADARTAHAPKAGTYKLAFIALNSLLVFGDVADQRCAVRTLAEHLAPGGLAVVDVWLPDAEDLVRYDGRLGLEYVRRDPGTDRKVTKMASALHDAATGSVHLTSIFDEGRQGEPAVRWLREDRLTLISAAELRGLAEGAGLAVEVLAGGYDLQPLGPGDDRAVLVAVRPTGGAPRSTRSSSSAARRHGQAGATGLV